MSQGRGGLPRGEAALRFSREMSKYLADALQSSAQFCSELVSKAPSDCHWGKFVQTVFIGEVKKHADENTHIDIFFSLL